jgi:hypothetical protein
VVDAVEDPGEIAKRGMVEAGHGRGSLKRPAYPTGTRKGTGRI